jgi:hypothetical protein
MGSDAESLSILKSKLSDYAVRVDDNERDRGRDDTEDDHLELPGVVVAVDDAREVEEAVRNREETSR